MTVYFVSRHDGARRWAQILQKQGNWPHPVDAYVDHLDVSALKKGDVVIGTLPLREAAAVRQRGAEFFSLDLQVPPHWRGQELTATQMAACGATLTSYRLTVKETVEMHPVNKKPRAVKTSPAVTVMLVSQELMPQYLGFAQAPTPQVILAVTKSMSARAEALDALLQAAPQPPERIKRLHLDESQGYADLLKQAEALLDKLHGDGAQEVSFNLTGGTKLMAMAFAQAGQAAQRMGDAVNLQYIDTANGVIEQIQGSRSTRLPLPARVGVREAVLASGKADAGCASASVRFAQQMKRKALHDHLIDASVTMIGSLNQLAMDMEALCANPDRHSAWLDGKRSKPKAGAFTLVRPVQDKADFRLDSLRKALAGKLGALLHEQGVLSDKPTLQDGLLSLKLPHSAEIDYLKGGWLEAHLASIIAAAGPDDWACGVQIGQEHGRNNEIDAIVTCGNRTLLVEVKTANLARDSVGDGGEKSSKGQDAIYKLDSIGHDLARNFNDNWLVSARALSTVDVVRAKDKRIKVFAPQGKEAPARAAIKPFTEALHEWIGKARAVSPVQPGQTFTPLKVSSDWKKKEKNAFKDSSAPAKKGAARGALSDTNLAKLESLKPQKSPAREG
ncbi:MAG: CRISPR-associated protein Csx16 [Thiomonas sp.]|uniref:CRISPR-associated protein Csx16 n=1 Tax=Thiomonas sp. TaxID=2047785 RepID=UPI002A36D24E|nr:CRISPR-associated protein Csx16 [Thiomonas sp.]MDY0331718.1 CRISPR-associated protein Csx16 [Thiomonas sp.]